MEDASGAGIGEIEETVYDAVSDVLKYAVGGSSPALEDPSGEFDRRLRAHHEEPG